MKILFTSTKILVGIVFLIWLVGTASINEASPVSGNDFISVRDSTNPSPVYTPSESIAKMHLEEGFEVKLVASEPMVTAPVALSFDKDGRMWVVQMNDYMPDTLGTGEDKPTGKIVILSDKDNDGVMDERKVFLDSLVLPRAISLVENGILVAEPPNLWYYGIQNDKPVKKVLVDATYAAGGNVEHQANGLLRAMDNWIYNAKSDKRYRKNGDKWLIEKTHFRGQWGITQDDKGRLFYNTNSENLLGDYFAPGLGATNANQRDVNGYIEKIVVSNKVFPIRATPGVNRGYMEGVLDDSLRLVNFTAACGPLIYNGDLFDQQYYGNGFVAEPSANLIKRNILNEKGYVVEGRQAYFKKEFLASEDERFRPVNLHNGPDGAMYVVDFYRGIIQHKTYLTPYLKNEIKKRELTQPLSCGRIYKIVPKNKKATAQKIIDESAQLVGLLGHKNSWVRNTAQQLIIDSKYAGLASSLRNNLATAGNPLSIVHSLWTLEGLKLLNENDVMPLLAASDWSVRMQALAVLPSIMTKTNYAKLLPPLEQLIKNNDTLAAPYIAFVAHTIKAFDKGSETKILEALKKMSGMNVYLADAIISNMYDREAAYYKEVVRTKGDTLSMFNKRLKNVLTNINRSKNVNSREIERQYPKGVALFRTICQTCHGRDGNGVKALAPPLNESEWVVGDKNRLAAIVLYGLSGPIQVGGKLYKAPEVNGDMPGIGYSKDISDEDVAQLLSYIRNSWNNKASKVDVAEITKTRKLNQNRAKAFTVKELGSSK
ncbi:MAG TPA: c-type cytochrome [Chitinophagaceae bacterium]|nr:c-type cytochrome [Chitinophagaceae bacterium]